MNILIGFSRWISRGTTFMFNRQFFFFYHVRNSLATNSHLKQRVLIFWPNLPKNCIFGTKKLPDGLNSNVKLFASVASLFSVVRYITDPANLLNSDLSKGEWARQWKMSFNLYSIKQAQEIKFIPKTSKRNYPSLMFNNEIVNLTSNYKYLGIIFDSKLSFDKHVKPVLKT